MVSNKLFKTENINFHYQNLKTIGTSQTINQFGKRKKMYTNKNYPSFASH